MIGSNEQYENWHEAQAARIAEAINEPTKHDRELALEYQRGYAQGRIDATNEAIKAVTETFKKAA